MAIKVAINGYGRIGRNILRAHYEGGKKHVRNGEEQLEERDLPVGCQRIFQHEDGNHEQSIVGKRRKELRGHDHVEAERHRALCAGTARRPCAKSAPLYHEARTVQMT